MDQQETKQKIDRQIQDLCRYLSLRYSYYFFIIPSFLYGFYFLQTKVNTGLFYVLFVHLVSPIILTALIPADSKDSHPFTLKILKHYTHFQYRKTHILNISFWISILFTALFQLTLSRHTNLSWYLGNAGYIIITTTVVIRIVLLFFFMIRIHSLLKNNNL